MKLAKDQFRCSACGGVFKKGRSEEEALAECQQEFGVRDKKVLAVLCDDCWLHFMKLYRQNCLDQ